MESSFPKEDEFKNNRIRECPYCNAIIPLSEYNDHLICHQIDQQENGSQSFNINNYDVQRRNNNNQINNKNKNSINENPSHNNQMPQNKNSININNNNSSNKKEESFIDKIKNFIHPTNNDNENDLLNRPIESLSPEEKEKRYKIEEQRAYEKKILGIAKPNGKIRGDNRSKREKISGFIQDNSDTFLAVIDLIGCLTLRTPAIGRTIVRVGNFVENRIRNRQNNQRNNINELNINNIEFENYESIIRAHPELKKVENSPDVLINFLPVSEIKEIRNNKDNNSNNNKCVICLCEFEIGDQVSALPCAHVFHTECIADWIKKQCLCPVCKFPISLKTLVG